MTNTMLSNCSSEETIRPQLDDSLSHNETKCHQASQLHKANRQLQISRVDFVLIKESAVTIEAEKASSEPQTRFKHYRRLCRKRQPMPFTSVQEEHHACLHLRRNRRSLYGIHHMSKPLMTSVKQEKRRNEARRSVCEPQTLIQISFLEKEECGLSEEGCSQIAQPSHRIEHTAGVSQSDRNRSRIGRSGFEAV